MNVNNIMDLGGSQSASKSSKTSSNKSQAASSDLFKSIYGQKQSNRQSGLDVQGAAQQSGKTNTQQAATKKDTTVQGTSSKNDTAPVQGNESAPAEDLENVAAQDVTAEDVNVSEPEGDEVVTEDEQPVAEEVSEEETEEPQDTDVQTPIFVMQMPIVAPMISTVVITQEVNQVPNDAILNDVTAELPVEQPQMPVMTEDVQPDVNAPVQTEEQPLFNTVMQETAEEPVVQVTDALKDVVAAPQTQTVQTQQPTPQSEMQTQTTDGILPEEEEILPEENVQQPAPEEHTEHAQTVPVQQETAPETTTAQVSTEADKFAAQVVKEAKDMAKNEPVQETGKDAVISPEEEIERPVEAKENADDTDDTADKGSEQPKTTQTQTTTPGTAQITDDGRVDFRTSAAQPLEAEQFVQPETRQMIMNRVVEQVRSAVSPNRTEFYIQLKPDYLGGLSIGLVAEEKGIVAKIMTTSQQVHNALQADMTALQQVLRDRGINVVEMEVIYNNLTDSAMQDDSSGQQQQFGQSGRRNHGRTSEIADEALTMYDTLSAYEVLAENGGSVEFNA